MSCGQRLVGGGYGQGAGCSNRASLSHQTSPFRSGEARSRATQKRNVLVGKPVSLGDSVFSSESFLPKLVFLGFSLYTIFCPENISTFLKDSVFSLRIICSSFGFFQPRWFLGFGHRGFGRRRGWFFYCGKAYLQGFRLFTGGKWSHKSGLN